MNRFFSLRRWAAFWAAIAFSLWGGWFSPTTALPVMPNLAPALQNLPNWPLNQFPPIPCTTELQTQFNERAGIPLSCELGEMVSSEKILAIGNFTSMGLPQSSLKDIADLNGIDLNNISADQLQKFYRLVTPKILRDRIEGAAEEFLADMPLVTEALVEDLKTKVLSGDLSQLGTLNEWFSDYGGISGLIDGSNLNTDRLREELSKLTLDKVLKALPSFSDFSIGNLPPATLQSFSVAGGIPALATQGIGNVTGVESLAVGDLGAVGLPNVSMSQMPKPIALAANAQYGRFDFPLGNDEQNPQRHLAGGLPENDHHLRKLACSDQCKYVEVATADSNYHGAAWIESSHFVPDGFGAVCIAWPGGCNGPAGNNPFGDDLRLLINNIDPTTGTAQVAVSMRMCWDIWLVGRTCTPAVFPLSSGFPLYTIKEGDPLPFVVPVNYNAA
jgi:hypothetical protein